MADAAKPQRLLSQRLSSIPVLNLEQSLISLFGFKFNLLQIRQHVSPKIRKGNDERVTKKSAGARQLQADQHPGSKIKFMGTVLALQVTRKRRT
jgi:hypothetical protein